MKIFNFILTILLSFQFITGYAQPLGTISPAIPKIHIPEDYGAILKKWDSGQNDKLIIHIQDAHCNYEAQTNIARILEGLINDYGVDLVCVEGAEGPVDTAPFSRQADRKVREKVVNKYLRRGYLSASEALAITKGEELEFSIYGLEDLGLYLENFQELRGVLGNQQISKKYLAALRGACQRLKKKIYNKELWEFDRQAVTYHEQGMGLVEWISFLKRRMKDDVQGSRWTNFNFVVESIDLEKKIDFKEVEREREGLVKELEKRLVAEELKKVVEQGVLFKAGKIPALEFYQDLEAVYTHSSKAVPQSGAVYTHSSKAVSKRSLGATLQVEDQDEYSELLQYIELLRLQNQIDGDLLFKELAEIEAALREKLYQNEKERDLDRTAYNLRVLSRLLNLILEREQWQYYQVHRAEFVPARIQSFIFALARENNISLPPIFEDKSLLLEINPLLKTAEDFYRQALARDEVLTDNLLSRMTELNEQVAVVVTGGFHSAGILERLRERGLSYLVIAPKITKLQDQDLYLSIMLDQQIDLDRVIVELGAVYTHSSKAVPKRSLGAEALAPPLALTRPGQLMYGARIRELLQLAELDVEGVDRLSPAELFSGRLAPGNLQEKIFLEKSASRAAYLIELYELALRELGDNEAAEKAEEVKRAKIVLSLYQESEFSDEDAVRKIFTQGRYRPAGIVAALFRAIIDKRDNILKLHNMGMGLPTDLAEIEEFKEKLVAVLAIDRNKPPPAMVGLVPLADVEEIIVEQIVAQPKNLYIVSAPPGAGKSSFTAELAQKIAARGLKVRVIDRDDYQQDGRIEWMGRKRPEPYEPGTVYIVEGYESKEKLYDVYKTATIGAVLKPIAQIGFFVPYEECYWRLTGRKREGDESLIGDYDSYFDWWFLGEDFSLYDFVVDGRSSTEPVGARAPPAVMPMWEELLPEADQLDRDLGIVPLLEETGVGGAYLIFKNSKESLPWKILKALGVVLGSRLVVSLLMFTGNPFIIVPAMVVNVFIFALMHGVFTQTSKQFWLRALAGLLFNIVAIAFFVTGFGPLWSVVCSLGFAVFAHVLWNFVALAPWTEEGSPWAQYAASYGSVSGEEEEIVTLELISGVEEAVELAELKYLNNQERVADFVAEKRMVDYRDDNLRELYDEVNEVLQNIIRANPRLPGYLKLYIDDTTEVNAGYYAGTNVVVVSYGYLKLLRDKGVPKDALALVIGHELAHVIQYRQDVDEGKEKAGMRTYDEITRGRQHGYTMEYDADFLGMELAATAGYNVFAASREWEALMEYMKDNELRELPCGSHPQLEERKRRMEDLYPLYAAAVFNEYTYLETSLDRRGRVQDTLRRALEARSIEEFIRLIDGARFFEELLVYLAVVQFDQFGGAAAEAEDDALRHSLQTIFQAVEDKVAEFYPQNRLIVDLMTAFALQKFLTSVRKYYGWGMLQDIFLDVRFPLQKIVDVLPAEPPPGYARSTGYVSTEKMYFHEDMEDCLSRFSVEELAEALVHFDINCLRFRLFPEEEALYKEGDKRHGGYSGEFGWRHRGLINQLRWHVYLRAGRDWFGWNSFKEGGETWENGEVVQGDRGLRMGIDMLKKGQPLTAEEFNRWLRALGHMKKQMKQGEDFGRRDFYLYTRILLYLIARAPEMTAEQMRTILDLADYTGYYKRVNNYNKNERKMWPLEELLFEELRLLVKSRGFAGELKKFLVDGSPGRVREEFMVKEYEGESPVLLADCNSYEEAFKELSELPFPNVGFHNVPEMMMKVYGVSKAAEQLDFCETMFRYFPRDKADRVPIRWAAELYGELLNNSSPQIREAVLARLRERGVLAADQEPGHFVAVTLYFFEIDAPLEIGIVKRKLTAKILTDLSVEDLELLNDYLLQKQEQRRLPNYNRQQWNKGLVFISEVAAYCRRGQKESALFLVKERELSKLDEPYSEMQWDYATERVWGRNWLNDAFRDPRAPRYVTPLTVWRGAMRHFDWVRKSEADYQALAAEALANFPPSVYRNYLLLVIFVEKYLNVELGLQLTAEAVCDHFFVLDPFRRQDLLVDLMARQRKEAVWRLRMLTSHFVVDRRGMLLGGEQDGSSVGIAGRGMFMRREEGDQWKAVYEQEHAEYTDYQFFTENGLSAQVGLVAASLNQQYLADLLDSNASLTDKLNEILAFFPQKSPHRDYWLNELMSTAGDNLEQIKAVINPEKKDKAFHKNSLFAGRYLHEKYALRALELELSGREAEFGYELGVILHYFADYSLTRDDLLIDLTNRLAKNKQEYQLAHEHILRRAGKLREEDKQKLIVRADTLKQLLQLMAKPEQKSAFLIWFNSEHAPKPAFLQEIEYQLKINLDGLKEQYSTYPSSHYQHVGRSMRQEFFRSFFYGEKGIFSSEESLEEFLLSVFNEYVDKQSVNEQTRKLILKIYLNIFREADPGRRETVLLALMDNMAETERAADGGGVHYADGVAIFLESLGFVGVKLGQYLATSPLTKDNPELRARLQKLKDKAEPMDKRVAFEMLEELFGDFDRKFLELGKVIGSASLKVVYKARLVSGKEVVAKLLRPEIRWRKEKDLALLRQVAEGMAGEIDIPPDMIDTIERMIEEELDLELEGQTQREIKTNIESEPQRRVYEVAGIKYILNVPLAKADDTKRNLVMIEEFADGVLLSDEEGLAQRGIDSAAVKDFLARELIMRQLALDGTYHADLHEGNVIVTKKGNEVTIHIIDFGAAGRISPAGRMQLFGIITAIYNQDLTALKEVLPAIGQLAMNEQWRIEDILAEEVHQGKKLLRILTMLNDAGIKISEEFYSVFRMLQAAGYLVERINPDAIKAMLAASGGAGLLSMITGAQQAKRPEAPSHMEGLQLKNDGAVPQSGTMTWRGERIADKDINEVITAAKERKYLSRFREKIAGKTVLMDKRLLSRYKSFGFRTQKEFKDFLKQFMAEQFRLSPPKKDEIVIGLLDQSSHLFEDHIQNGFIGINKQLFNRNISKVLRRRLFKLGLRHELRHEHGVGNNTVDEEMLLEEDFIYAVSLGISAAELKKTGIFLGGAGSLLKRLRARPAQVAVLAQLRNVEGIVNPSAEVCLEVTRLARQAFRDLEMEAEDFVVVVSDSDQINAGIDMAMKIVQFNWGMLEFLRRNNILDLDTIKFLLGHEAGHELVRREKKAAEEEGEEHEHSRLSAEYQADEYGLYAVDAGDGEVPYTPLAGVRFMEALSREDKKATIGITHPQSHRRQMKLYHNVRSRYWQSLHGAPRRVDSDQLEIDRSGRFAFANGLYGKLSLANLRAMLSRATSHHDLLRIMSLFNVLIEYQLALEEVEGAGKKLVFGYLSGRQLEEFKKQRKEKGATLGLTEKFLLDQGVRPGDFFSEADRQKIADEAADEIQAGLFSLDDALLYILAREIQSRSRSLLKLTAPCIHGGIEELSESSGQLKRRAEICRERYAWFSSLLRKKLLELLPELSELSVDDQREMEKILLPGVQHLEIDNSGENGYWGNLVRLPLVSVAYNPQWDDPLKALRMLLRYFSRYENDYLGARPDEQWAGELEKLELFLSEQLGWYNKFNKIILETLNTVVNTPSLATRDVLTGIYRTYLISKRVLPESEVWLGDDYREILEDVLWQQVETAADFMEVYRRLEDVVIGEFSELKGLPAWIEKTEDQGELLNLLEFMLSRPALRPQALRQLQAFMEQAVKECGMTPLAAIEYLDRVLAEQGLERLWRDAAYKQTSERLLQLHREVRKGEFERLRKTPPNLLAHVYLSLIRQVTDPQRQKGLIVKYYRKYGHWLLDIDLADLADNQLMKLLREILAAEGKTENEQLAYFLGNGLLPDSDLLSAESSAGWGLTGAYEVVAVSAGCLTGQEGVTEAGKLLVDDMHIMVRPLVRVEGSRKMDHLAGEQIIGGIRQGQIGVWNGSFYFLPANEAEEEAVRQAQAMIAGREEEKERLYRLLLANQQRFQENGVPEDEFNNLLAELCWSWFYPHNELFYGFDGLLAKLRPSRVTTSRSMNTKGLRTRLIEPGDCSEQEWELMFRLLALTKPPAGAIGIVTPRIFLKYGDFVQLYTDTRTGELVYGGEEHRKYLRERPGYTPIWARVRESKFQDLTLDWGERLLTAWLQRQGRSLSDPEDVWPLAGEDGKIAAVLRAYPRESRWRNRILIDLVGDPLRDPARNFEIIFPYLTDSEVKDILARRILVAKREAGELVLDTYEDVEKIIREYFPEDSEIGRELFNEFLQQARVTPAQLHAYQEQPVLERLARDKEKRVTHRILEFVADKLEEREPQDKREIFEWLVGIRPRDKMPIALQFYEYDYEVNLTDLPEMLQWAARSQRYALLTILFLGPQGILRDEEQGKILLESIFRAGTGEEPGEDNVLFLIFREVFTGSPDTRKMDLVAGIFDHFLQRQEEATAESRNQLIRQLLVSFGAVGVKLGQFLSKQPDDVISPDLKKVLEELSDEVDAIDKRYLLNALLEDMTLAEIEEQIEYIGELVGSASIKQGYRVVKKDGTEVVLKFVRATAHYEIEENLRILRETLQRLRQAGNARLNEVLERISEPLLEEVEETVRRELDMGQEVVAQVELAELPSEVSYNGWELGIPKVDPQLRGQQFFADEFISGEPLKEELIAELKEAGHYSAIAKLIFHSILRQILIHGRYHADLHAGNVFVDRENRQVSLLDFGNTGTFSVQNQLRLIMLMTTLQTAQFSGDISPVISVLRQITGQQELDLDITEIVTGKETSFAEKLRDLKQLLDSQGISLGTEYEVLAKTLESIGYLLEAIAPAELGIIFAQVAMERQQKTPPSSFAKVISGRLQGEAEDVAESEEIIAPEQFEAKLWAVAREIQALLAGSRFKITGVDIIQLQEVLRRAWQGKTGIELADILAGIPVLERKQVMEMGEAISGLDSLNELLGSQALVHGGQMVVSALAVVAKAEEQPTELSGEVSAAAPVADPALQAEVEEGV